MYTESDSQENTTLIVTPPIQLSAPWRVVSVNSQPNFQLYVRFLDGTEGILHLKSMIFSENAGVFMALRDPEVFEKAYVCYGAVTWPNELDLAPDAMYTTIKNAQLKSQKKSFKTD